MQKNHTRNNITYTTERRKKALATFIVILTSRFEIHAPTFFFKFSRTAKLPMIVLYPSKEYKSVLLCASCHMHAVGREEE